MKARHLCHAYVFISIPKGSECPYPALWLPFAGRMLINEQPNFKNYCYLPYGNLIYRNPDDSHLAYHHVHSDID